ncbi:MAG TPA: hypothetical protein VM573_04455, partial [Actinomycetota bacterium]|nr:hypothetical protein [Actinomycetota bacterium]
RPPTRRQFWAAILAHELAHCRPGQPGERFAYSWTGKAFDALGRPDLVEYARTVYEELEREGS